MPDHDTDADWQVVINAAQRIQSDLDACRLLDLFERAAHLQARADSDGRTIHRLAAELLELTTQRQLDAVSTPSDERRRR